MFKRALLLVVAALVFPGAEKVLAAGSIHGLAYTYPVDKLTTGQSLGNADCYATLDAKTDVASDRSSVRFGLKESTNQAYYLAGWEVSLESSGGSPFTPFNTTFTPASQETELKRGELRITKQFFLPFENNYLRSAHFLLEALGPAKGNLVIRSRTVFPEGVKIERGDFKGHSYAAVQFPDGAMAVLWAAAACGRSKGANC